MGGGGGREGGGEEGLSLIYNHPLTTDHRLGDVSLHTGSIACVFMQKGGKRFTASNPSSKHWFTTSFLQPLPHLVTP